jgi:ATP-dependent exoDNAse (exonuclease V) alpha subunit
VHSEVLLPEGAHEDLSERERPWTAVEACELRQDARLARKVEFALPRGISQADGIALAREFVQAEFVARGMIADLNVHWDRTDDGLSKPNARVMLKMREVHGTGFDAKVRARNRTKTVRHWRERWAGFANARLAERDIDARIDSRSPEAQGTALEPQDKIGAPAQRIESEGIEAADRAEMHRKIARNNGRRIIADPHIGLEAIKQQQSTSTRRHMAKFAHQHSDGTLQFNVVMGAMRGAPIASWSAGRSTTRPASATTRQLTCPVVTARIRQWATWRKACKAIRS